MLCCDISYCCYLSILIDLWSSEIFPIPSLPRIVLQSFSLVNKSLLGEKVSFKRNMNILRGIFMSYKKIGSK